MPGLSACLLVAGRRAALLALIGGPALLAACAPKPPVGDAKGGIIDWFATTKGQIQDSISGHCAAYGKKGRIIDQQSDKSGGHAIFVCE